jgi:beta-glucosidase
LKAMRAKAPSASIEFESGDELEAAISLAKKSDVAIVFAYQWESEGMDLKSLSLPGKQDDLIASVAAANPHTIVVLETGGPVLMPWADKVSGIVEAWYTGSRGAEAVTNVLVGEVNPSAKLPLTFPKSESDLPHPSIVKPPPVSRAEHYGTDAPKIESSGLPAFRTSYDEGLKVGYKWYDAENKPVLFPFGYGLSYTSFSYSGLKVNSASPLSVTFTVKNTGSAPEQRSPRSTRLFQKALPSHRSVSLAGAKPNSTPARAKRSASRWTRSSSQSSIRRNMDGSLLRESTSSWSEVRLRTCR